MIVFCAKNIKKTASHHRNSWIFPDHFVIPSHTNKKCHDLRHMRTANTHMSLRIRAAWPGIRYLLEQKCAETWELSLRHMRTANIHMSLRNRISAVCTYSKIRFMTLWLIRDRHRRFILCRISATSQHNADQPSELSVWLAVQRFSGSYLPYWDRQAWANSVYPDQKPQNAASRQCLHFLPLTQLFLDTKTYN